MMMTQMIVLYDKQSVNFFLTYTAYDGMLHIQLYN